MVGPNQHMYLPPIILSGDAGPVNELEYCDMPASSQASLVERPSQDAGCVVQHHPPRYMRRMTTQWICHHCGLKLQSNEKQ